MRVIPGVHLVASGWLGASMSDAHDCHVFLVDGDDDAYLVDAGCGIDTSRVLANIDRTGVDRGRIDHAAGAAALAGREVLFSGDLVFARGRVAILDTPDTDVDLMRASIEAVAARRPHALLAGHGSLVLGDAHLHLGTAIEAFESGSLPPSLVV